MARLAISRPRAPFVYFADDYLFDKISRLIAGHAKIPTRKLFRPRDNTSRHAAKRLDAASSACPGAMMLRAAIIHAGVIAFRIAGH